MFEENYVVSAFGDFSRVLPTSDNVKAFAERFGPDLVPSVFQEANPAEAATQPDAGEKRLMLTTPQGNAATVFIASGRVDYVMQTPGDIDFSKGPGGKRVDDVCAFFRFFCDRFRCQMCRLALNTDVFVTKFIGKGLGPFLAKFTNPLSMYNSASSTVWGNSLMTYVAAPVAGLTEPLCVVTALEKRLSLQVSKERDKGTAAFDGMAAHVDINTQEENRRFRFGPNHVGDFLSVADPIRLSILKELEAIE